MTFDEALEELKTLSKNGADTWYGDNLEKRTHVKGHIESGSVEMLVYKLRKEYAPTVEMTKKQYHSFKLWKYHTAGWNMTNCAEWARDEDITANNAMRAWLHPETIKIIGGNNDTATSSRNKD